MDAKCHACGKSLVEARLEKCPICFRYFCDEHGFARSGRPFCSRGCADHFFFSDPDE
jgi:hypothetical protein